MPQKKPNQPMKQQATPPSYNVKSESVAELVGAINELVTGKFSKKVLFDIINSTFVPNMPEADKTEDGKKDTAQDKK